ncbi:MAG: P-loop NTPase, partial [Litoreibacter sp.]|nr:P-loop NTPase [Litoreibacter sp.]
MAMTRDTVTAALKGIEDPVAGGDIMASGVVRALQVGEDGAVRFVMEIPPSQAQVYEDVKAAAEAALAKLEGIGSVSIVMTGHSQPAPPPDLKPQRAAQPKGPEKLPGVERIVAVASGKGGVGKSTVAAHLACALAQQGGRRVGLLDADVYGPSQPRMLGVSGRPASPDGKIILPMRNHGVTMMSIGLMTNEDQAVVWRGPMLMGALQQMMTQVQWGALDVLLVDLPPGTG